MTTPQTPAVRAAAWAFAMAHYDTIKRYAEGLALKSGTDADELAQAATEVIVSSFTDYKPDKGSPETWIYWQVRRCATNETRARGYGKVISCGMNPAEPDPLQYREATWGSVRVIEAGVDARAAYEAATPEEQEALDSRVEGWTGDEVRDGLGIGITARNKRIERLRRGMGL